MRSAGSAPSSQFAVTVEQYSDPDADVISRG